MKVLKFGGTSVGSAININKVIDILINVSANENAIAVVHLELFSVSRHIIETIRKNLYTVPMSEAKYFLQDLEVYWAWAHQVLVVAMAAVRGLNAPTR